MHGMEALFPGFDELRTVENSLSEKLGLVRERFANRKAAATDVPVEWLSALQAQNFDKPGDLEALMAWSIDALDTGIVQMTHPGYLGLFNPAPTFASECADRIAAAFNPQICVYSHAPAAVEIERRVLDEVARRAGLPEGSSGHFTSGGAEANSTAVLCALQRKCPEYGERGVVAFSGLPTIYASQESHLAWFKIAQATGVGRSAVRLVATDGQGRMDAKALESAILADLESGCIPTLIVATAGTTNAGMVDPLDSCAELAQKHGLWFHVDAAWGGAIIASPALSHAVIGIEGADSITIDAHKWFATTMGAGMFFTRYPEVPAEVFRVTASYMPDSDASKDYYLTSMQWSRRFVGLRLFLSLGAAGWEGFASHVERCVALTDRLTARLQQGGWVQANSSLLGVTCMIPREGPDAVQRYVDAVHEDGRFWISKATFEGVSVLRACVTNGRTDEPVIDEFADLLLGI